MSKYIKLMSLDYNNNRFNYSRKIDKYRFELIKNREKHFYKILAIFVEKKITKFKQSLFYLEEN